ncbi:MAG: ribose-phosphate diphosphokinase [Bacteroidota bacterium]
MVINLDPHFAPIDEPDILFDSFTFHGGEPHIRIQAFDTSKAVKITHRINSFNDLGLLCVAVDALKRMGVKSLNLFIPYFPGARQDRVMVPGESLTVKVIADIINALKLNSVSIYDPHSDVAPAVLDNCHVFSNRSFIAGVLSLLPKQPLLVSPDAGASKKIFSLASHLKLTDVLECGKKRDVSTGALSGFKVPESGLGGKPCLIVDDICDGGGTFIGLGKELKKRNAGKLYLAISHGIFSKGLDELSQVFERIFTTDSIRNLYDSRLTQINLSQLI